MPSDLKWVYCVLILTGINLAFCKLLHQSGCSVLIADLALHREAVPWVESIQKDQSNDAQGPKVVFHKIDVTDWKQLEDVFNVYDREIGGIPYIVCPGAGIYEPVCIQQGAAKPL